jgi:MFS family permease
MPIPRKAEQDEDAKAGDPKPPGTVRHFTVCCLIMGFYCLALFTWLPAFQLFLLKYACNDLNGGVHCDDSAVSARGATLYQRLLTTNTASSVLTNAGMSMYSDHIGRRPILIVNFGMGMAMFVGMFLVSACEWSVNAGIPFMVVCGLGGGSGVGIAMLNASTADITTGAERGAYVSALMGLLYVGGIFGPLIGGALTSAHGLSAAFAAATAFMGVSITILLLFFDESLSSAEMRRSRRTPVTLRAATVRAPRPPCCSALTCCLDTRHVSTAAATATATATATASPHPTPPHPQIGSVTFLFGRRATACLAWIYVVEYIVLTGTASLLVLFAKSSAVGLSNGAVGTLLAANYVGKVGRLTQAKPTSSCVLVAGLLTTSAAHRTHGKAFAVMVALPVYLRWDGRPLLGPLVGMQARHRESTTRIRRNLPNYLLPTYLEIAYRLAPS